MVLTLHTNLKQLLSYFAINYILLVWSAVIKDDVYTTNIYVEYDAS